MDTLDMAAAATRTPYMLAALQDEDANPTPIGGGLQGALYDQRRVKFKCQSLKNLLLQINHRYTRF
jgi:hypothetical protein